MTVRYDSQDFKGNSKTGFAIGLAVGLLVGAVAGGSVLLIFGASSTFAVGVLAVFALIFSGYGSFMGFLFDLDAKERSNSQARPVVLQARKFRRQRVKSESLPILR